GAVAKTPVFMLAVDATSTPEEGHRDPTWRPLREAETALRDGRSLWSSGWRVEAARAAAARLAPPPRPGRAA
ncbi:MAG: hypothetical protein M3Q20_01400, partial [Actinomycetota bacterium]|nr:hypothetical protein [Actinomycetota bacterium]